MAQPVLSVLPSIHAHVTSINARLSNRTLWGNGKFSVHFGNSFGITKTVKVVPSSVSIPNVFPNIRREWTGWSNDLEITASGSFLSKFYDIDEFITALSVIKTEGGDPIFVLDTPSGKITTNGGLDLITYNITMHPRVWIVMGWGDIVLAQSGNTSEEQATWTWTGTTTDVPSTYFQLLLPNLAGEQIIHLSFGGHARANMVASLGGQGGTGSIKDVMLTVPIADTPYGGLHTRQTSDMWIDDIDFRQETNMADVVVEILDDRFNPLYIPTNHHVSISFKVYHADELRE
jgi:hypothetical protein